MRGRPVKPVKQKIPTNIITGFLGAGKTIAIQSLLTQRPAGERWSIFVNGVSIPKKSVSSRRDA